jgi:hypothetical protein
MGKLPPIPSLLGTDANSSMGGSFRMVKRALPEHVPTWQFDCTAEERNILLMPNGIRGLVVFPSIEEIEDKRSHHQEITVVSRERKDF